MACWDLPVDKIHQALAHREGPLAALDLDAAVASKRLKVKPCAQLPNPLEDPAVAIRSPKGKTFHF